RPAHASAPVHHACFFGQPGIVWPACGLPRRNDLMSKLAYFACAAFFFAPAMPADDAALAADLSQARVEFTLGDVLHTVHVRFAVKGAGLRFDAASGKASGEIVVDAASGGSGSGARDRRMHKEVLDSARYPEIVFRPDRVEGRIAPQGISQVMVHGLFTI